MTTPKDTPSNVRESEPVGEWVERSHPQRLLCQRSIHRWHVGSVPVLALMFFLFTGSMMAQVTPTPTPVVNGKIVFTSLRNSPSPFGGETYVMDPDGSNQLNLTTYPMDRRHTVPLADRWPAWSPDGSKIAFARTEGWGGVIESIYVMNADGSNQIRLTYKATYDRYPAWSPDGTKIVFASNFQIYLMNADGSNQIRLTDSPTNDIQPVWSPDGTKIAFARNFSPSGCEIYVIDADGSNETCLTNTPGRRNFGPAWSPDGTKIAFSSDRAELNHHQIHVMNADGSNQIALTNYGVSVGPEWSPDGTKIAFTGVGGTNSWIVLMDADGSNLVVLTSYIQDSCPRWQRLPGSRQTSTAR